jgi:hypothetical protein
MDSNNFPPDRPSTNNTYPPNQPPIPQTLRVNNFAQQSQEQEYSNGYADENVVSTEYVIAETEEIITPANNQPPPSSRNRVSRFHRF